jgi:DHA1 family solute carrier family 18 vesicular amine transporter 1/2
MDSLHASIGLMSDTIVYSLVIPVMPFKLKQMGYEKISSDVGWLLFAYVC